MVQYLSIYAALVVCGIPRVPEDLHFVLSSGLHGLSLVILSVPHRVGLAIGTPEPRLPDGGGVASLPVVHAAVGAAEPPDADGDGEVAGGDDDERHEEHGQQEKHHVRLLPDLPSARSKTFIIPGFRVK